MLAPAMASSNAVTVFAGILFGIRVFGETLAHGNGRLVPALLGLVVAVVGVALLGGSESPTAEQETMGNGVPVPAPET